MSRYQSTKQDTDLLVALQDTVIRTPSPSGDRGFQESQTSPRDANSRRTQHDQASSQPVSTTKTSSKQAGSGRSKDDPFADRPSEKTKTSKPKAPVPPRKSRHADVIDRLDPSSLWGGTIHHESAYDAAAPSRNKATSATAPMRAFDSAGQPTKSPSGNANANPNLSTLASHTLARMGSVKFNENEKPDSATTPTGVLNNNDDTYFVSALGVSGSEPATPSAEDKDRGGVVGRGLRLIRSRSRSREGKGLVGGERPGAIPGIGSMPAEEDYYNARAKHQKNALANAWGVADPEPFEDFGHIAPGEPPKGETGLASASSSIWNGMESHSARTNAGGSSGLSQTVKQDVDSDEQETLDHVPTAGSYNARKTNGHQFTQSTGAGVTRTKSLIKRFKAMRENPNVPVDSNSSSPRSEHGPPSPTAGVFSTSLPTSAGLSSSSTAQQSTNQAPAFQRKPSFMNRIGRSHSNSSPNGSGSWAGSGSGSGSGESPNGVSIPLGKEVNIGTIDNSSTAHSPIPPNTITTTTTTTTGSDRLTKDKSLPQTPRSDGLNNSTGNPFSDPKENRRQPSYSNTSRRKQESSATSHTRSAPPPPAPINLPGSGSDDHWDLPSASSQGGVSGGEVKGAGLGRKASLMKRVLGRG
ncbi:Pal1 cell morphology [Phaffia rhodozyma]|uniref:Pal1 cell morphology n=1 Tax=Phaffia rhodozyma TaxID=264483 RepID=A0A0F7SGK9_PHARH|nr:Pal1 cell morphology [Phaffia rhodozyma]